MVICVVAAFATAQLLSFSIERKKEKKNAEGLPAKVKPIQIKWIVIEVRMHHFDDDDVDLNCKF